MSWKKKLRNVLGLGLCLITLSGSGFASANLDIQKIADGVYAVSPKPGSRVGSNAAVVVNGDGVLIVDTHLRPSFARELLVEVKKITPLPVRYVVNTHWHNDHIQGNQAYFNVFPRGVEFLAHTNARREILNKAIPQVDEQLRNLPGQIRELEEKLAAVRDKAERARLEAQVQSTRSYLEELQQINITLPTFTFDRSLFLHGSRDIHIHYFGRGHTAGDVVVFLPKERVLMTGDLFLGTHIPFSRDSYPSEWAATLKAASQLDFDWVIPGHKNVENREDAKIHFANLIAFFEDVVPRVQAMAAAGKTLDQVKEELDLSKYKTQFANFTTHSGMVIERAYAEASGRLKE